MTIKRKIVKSDLTEKQHRIFKLKCGERGMKDQLRKLIVAFNENRIIIKDSNINE
jgi:hypothetical protein